MSLLLMYLNRSRRRERKEEIGGELFVDVKVIEPLGRESLVRVSLVCLG